MKTEPFTSSMRTGFYCGKEEEDVAGVVSYFNSMLISLRNAYLDFEGIRESLRCEKEWYANDGTTWSRNGSSGTV